MYTEGLTDKIELIDVGATRPHRSTGNKFSEDAGDCPDINRRPVLRVTDQQLRRPVPPRRYVVRELVTRFCSERIIT